MNRNRNDHDNAPLESFFGILKKGMFYHRKYRTRQEAIAEICADIEVFFNRQRRHPRLGNISPTAYWRKFIRQQGAA
jgi:putative transposase